VGRTDREADLTKLIDAIRNFAKVNKKIQLIFLYVLSFEVLLILRIFILGYAYLYLHCIQKQNHS